MTRFRWWLLVGAVVVVGLVLAFGRVPILGRLWRWLRLRERDAAVRVADTEAAAARIRAHQERHEELADIERRIADRAAEDAARVRASREALEDRMRRDRELSDREWARRFGARHLGAPGSGGPASLDHDHFDDG